MKKIILTGGGTAGHVTPNIALLPYLRKEGFEISYIGTKDGIEKGLMEREGIPYEAVATGKLRRYFSSKNFTDIFRVAAGVKEAYSIIRRIKPDVVFSKGGFVAVPVVLGAKLVGVPIVIHESDITPGLANKIAMPFAKYVCTTFPETVRYISGNKGIHTGTPIRDGLFEGEKKRGLALCGFDGKKPVLMMMGGSLGSVKINTELRKALPVLLESFQVVHICGKGNRDSTLEDMEGYRQFEYVSEELPHIFAMADAVISRAGSNSISEFLALRKPNLLIPLSQNASRGDQILNAASFERQGFSMVLKEEDMTAETLIDAVNSLYQNREKYTTAMEANKTNRGVENVMEVILKTMERKTDR